MFAISEVISSSISPVLLLTSATDSSLGIGIDLGSIVTGAGVATFSGSLTTLGDCKGTGLYSSFLRSFVFRF